MDPTPFKGEGWGAKALWDKVPERHRLEDADGLLEGFLRAAGSVLEDLQRLAMGFPDLIDPMRAPSAASRLRPLLLGPVVAPLGRIKHRGTDGSINAFGQFVTARGKFRAADVGDTITILGSSIIGNNRTVSVGAVISPGIVATTPALPADAGPLRWVAREAVPADSDRVTVQVQGGDVGDITPGWVLQAGGAPFRVLARRHFPKPGPSAKMTDRAGVDGTVNSQGRFSSPSAALTQADVGKRISFRIPKAPENDLWEIQAVDPSGSHAWFSHFLARGADSNGGVIYALKPGQALKVAHVVSGVNSSLRAELVGDLLTVYLATNSVGAASSSAAAAAAAATTAAAARATISATGNGTGLAGALALQPVPGRAPPAMATAFEWTILPFPELELAGRVVPLGVVERAGGDLSVTVSAAASTVQISEGVLAAGDVGKILRIRGSAVGNDGDHLIASVTGAGLATVAAVLTVEAGPLRWQIRAAAGAGNSSLVTAQSPDLLRHLASNFGLASDVRESDMRRRQWVARHPLWVDAKGTDLSYRVVGALTGFNVKVLALYRITQDLFGLIPPASRFELGDLIGGRSGGDGQLLVADDGRPCLVAPSASFKSTDVGRSVRITGASNGANDKLYTIETVSSSTRVVFRVLDAAAAPDSNNGILKWIVLRLYTSLPPLLPRFDEMDADLMKFLIDGNPPSTNHFGVDKFAWEADWNSKIGVGGGGSIVLTAASHVAPTLWTLTFTGDCKVVTRVGNWRFIDAAGRAYWMETAPVTGDGGATWTLNVAADSAPTLGAGAFEYVCDPQVIPGYVLSSRLLVILEPGDVVRDEGAALEEVYQRAVRRIRDEVAAAKVEMVSMLRVTAPAVFRFGARIVTP